MPSPTEAHALLASKLQTILLRAQKKFESNQRIAVYEPKFKITGIGVLKVLVIETSSPSAAKAVHNICVHSQTPLSYRCEGSSVSVTLENKKKIDHVLKIMTEGFDSDEAALDADVPDNYLSSTSPEDVSENVPANANTPIIAEALPTETEEDYEKNFLNLKLFMKQSPFKSGIHYAPAKMNTRLMDGAKTASVSVLEIEFRDAIVEYFGKQNLSDFVFTEESSKTIRVLLKGFSPVLKEVKDTPKKKIVPTEEKAKVPTPVVPSEPPVVLPVKNEKSNTNNQTSKTENEMAKFNSLKKVVTDFLKANKIGYLSVIPNEKKSFDAVNLKTAEDQKVFVRKAKQAQLSEFIELSGEKVVRVFKGFTFEGSDIPVLQKRGPGRPSKKNAKKKAVKAKKSETASGPAILSSLMNEWQADKETIKELSLQVEELKEKLSKFEELKKQLKSVL